MPAAGEGRVAAPSTLGALLRHVRDTLSAAGSSEASLEARLIVEEAAGVTRTDLVTGADRPLPRNATARTQTMLKRRLAGEPVYRVLGWREFHGLKLALSPETLEPRDDTEALVALALGHVREAVRRRGACRILDLGTGTGAVALALLAEEPAATAVGCDISPGALEIAARNADINGIGGRFEGVRSDWFGNVPGRFDVIVSNPPYISSDEIETLDRTVRDHDPRAALDGGSDGLAAYRIIAAGCAAALEPLGAVAMEIGIGQGRAVEDLFARHGLRLRETARDLGGIERALGFTMA